MFFKFTILSLLSLALVSCGIHIGESAPSQKAITYRGKGFACVGEIPRRFEQYVNDELGAPQISAFTLCLQGALTDFMGKISDRYQETYNPEDIRRFLQEYFLKDRRLTDGIVTEFMKVKRVLVGGSLDVITRPELLAAIGLLEDIRVEAVNLKPYLPYLNATLLLNQPEQNLAKHLSDANKALNHSIDVFAAKFKNSKEPYKLSDLAAFMREFRNFTDWDHRVKTARPVESWIDLLQIFKEITVSPKHPDRIGNDEWGPLLYAGARWYLGFLDYTVGVRGKDDGPGPDLKSGPGLQNLISLGKLLFNLAGDAIEAQAPNYIITYDQLNRLFVAFHGIGWIPKKIHVESINTLVKALLFRMFTPDDKRRPNDRESFGLIGGNLDAMRMEFERWYKVQLDLERQFNPSQNPSDLAALTPRLRFEGQEPPEQADERGQKSQYWDDFTNVESIRPLFSSGLPHVMLVYASAIGTPKLHQGFYNLSAMNLLYSATRVMFRGYAEDTGWMWSQGVTADEMQSFYKDIKPFGVDLGIVDQRNDTSGSRAFKEGKLFTYASQGLYPDAPGLAGEMSVQETMTYLAFLYSGSNEATEMFKDLLNICKNSPDDDLDGNGLHKVDRACAIKNFTALMDKYMTNMPRMLEYLRGLPETGARSRETFAATAIQTAFIKGKGNSEEAWLEKSELTTVAVVISYVESVMTNYNSSQTGYLTLDELKKAEPKFHQYIKKMALDTASNETWRICEGGFNKHFIPFCNDRARNEWIMNDEYTEGTFYFMLDQARKPESAGDLWHLREDYVKSKPVLHLDRLALMTTFKSIIQALLESSKSKPPPAAAPGK